MPKSDAVITVWPLSGDDVVKAGAIYVEVRGNGFTPDEPVQGFIPGDPWNRIDADDAGEFVVEVRRPDGVFDLGTYTFVAYRWQRSRWVAGPTTTLVVE